MTDATGTSAQVAPGYQHQRFRIDGGDGDQRLFGSPLIMERVVAPWFNGELGQLFGDAWLVRVIDGPKAGLLLALAPHSLGEIAGDITEIGWKMVVVHGITYPGYDLAAYGPPSTVGGMAAMELLGGPSRANPHPD